MGEKSFVDTLKDIEKGKNPIVSQTNSNDGLKTLQHGSTENGLNRLSFGLKTINESAEDEN